MYGIIDYKKDAHEFYKKFGFKDLSNPERFMEIFNGYYQLIDNIHICHCKRTHIN